LLKKEKGEKNNGRCPGEGRGVKIHPVLLKNTDL
jgi:hypothetical protein